ncbi:MAG: hypothetical protein HKN22_08295 [Bacteroidia bacterium]|nr:hypothetical protein [Bacteroidia bacterium]
MSKINPRVRTSAVQKTTVVQKFWLGLGGAATLSLACYFAIFLSTNEPEKATANSGMDIVVDDLNNGEVLSVFTFDQGDPIQPDIGVAGIDINQWAKCLPGGKNATMGLGSTNKEGDISLILENSEALNRDGIDISLDYVRKDKNCQFFTRGNNFDFGIKKGRVFIKMELEDKFGRTNLIEEDSRYVIPMDDQFRNYRFIFDPVKGLAEIFVNKIPIWKYKTFPNQKIKWETSKNVIIGTNIFGSASSRAVIDNIFIRATSSVDPLPVELYSFTAKTVEGKVRLSWNTGEEYNIDHYIIERSTDSETFRIIGMVAANNSSADFNNYQFEDFNPSNSLVFYRIRIKETNQPSVLANSESKSLPTIVYSYKSDIMENDKQIIDSYNQVTRSK